MGVPLNRFEEIRRNLHFSDNNNEPPRVQPTYDRACKISPIMNQLNESFQNAMSNTKTQSIDEHIYDQVQRAQYNETVCQK